MSALSWWYRLSAPAAGSASVSVAQSAASRERVRRGRLASLILLVVILLQIVSLAIVLVSHDYRLLPLVALSLVVCGLAIILNRIGMATIAGVLVIAVIDLGCGLLLLTTPNGLGVRDLPAFDVLVESELVAVSLLPAVSVFYVAAGNCLFIVGDILLQPHASDLNQLVASPDVYNVFARPLSLQVVAAVVAYLWVRSALRSAARADHAEELAELRRREAERSRELEIGIQDLLRTHVRAANGDLAARTTLSRSNVLWQVGASLNFLLARLQNAGRAERELQRIHGQLLSLTEAIRAAKAGRHPDWPAPSGTSLDPLLQELVPASRAPTRPRLPG